VGANKRDVLARADRALAIALSLILATVSACVGAAARTQAVRTVTVTRPLVEQVVKLMRVPEIPAAISALPASTDTVLAQLLAEHRCLAEAMYFEARGEGEKGEMAVAEVIFHRVEGGDHGRSICAVVYEGSDRTACQFSFVCDGSRSKRKSPQDWRNAEALAARILARELRLGDETGGAVNYHATSVRPDWAARLVRTAQIGNHIFYRPRVAALDNVALRGTER
jgi:spore germination cell wall hydrolase CwlJ-like protein